MTGVLTDLALTALLLGLLPAAVWDVARREVPDACWQILGVFGAGLGVAILYPSASPIGLVLWLLVAGLAVEHFFDWETPLRFRSVAAPPWIEAAAYGACVVAVAAGVVAYGVAPQGVPYAVVAALVVVVVARGLYEIGVISGGADARALMAMAIVVPIAPITLFALPSAARQFFDVVPFALNALVNGLVLVALVVPTSIAIRNLVRREFTFPSGFVSYTIPTSELPSRHVWSQEPRSGGVFERGSAETAQEDLEHRIEIARDLIARGISRVRVSPQIPLVAFLAAGALLAWVGGNLVGTLFALL